MTDESDLIADGFLFAQVVQTSEGEALLISGRVYKVTGPGGNCADVFFRAMRRTNREAVSAQGGSGLGIGNFVAGTGNLGSFGTNDYKRAARS